MKKVLSVALSLIMALSVFTVLPFTANAEDLHNEITYTIENSGNTFTVTRSSADITQTVGYRTAGLATAPRFLSI